MNNRAALGTLFRSLGRDGQRRLSVLAVLTVLGGIAEFATLVALLHLLRSWLVPRGSWDGGAALAFALAVLFAGASRIALLAATQRLAFDTGHRLLVAVQRRVLARDWLAHASARGSGPLAALEQVDLVIYGVLLPLLQGASAAVLGSAILAALVRINASAALLAALLLGGLFAATVYLCRPTLARAGTAINRSIEERIATTQEHSGAMRELILAGARGAAAERFRRVDHELAQGRASLALVSGLPRLLVETLGLLALTLLAWWLAERSGGLGAALPTLAALALGAQRLLPLAQTFSQAWSGIAGNAPALQRLATLLAKPDLAEDAPPPPLPFDQRISLRQVGFTYPGRSEPALHGIDLYLRRGERVALIGRNGSGKSTLADLVMGLIAPGEGEIRIDDRLLLPAQVRAWQRNVAHVPQAPFLADASLARNIAFTDPEPDHVRVVEAARLAGLHEFIDALPRGYESRAGSGGLLLSGGQRQRLALARALYDPAPLLVLDEATSALDPESEQHVLLALDVLQARGTTILLIAHRASMLEHCTQQVRLEAGRIVAA